MVSYKRGYPILLTLYVLEFPTEQNFWLLGCPEITPLETETKHTDAAAVAGSQDVIQTLCPPS